MTNNTNPSPGTYLFVALVSSGVALIIANTIGAIA